MGRMSLDSGLTGAKTDSVFLKMNKNSDMQTQDMVQTRAVRYGPKKTIMIFFFFRFRF